MSVALDCVSGEPLSRRTAEFIELGRRAGDQQQSMIREVLQAFSADLRATLDTETSANSSPDLFHVARQVAESQSPPFAAKNVRIKLALPTAPEQCRIRGEESRLQRVFANLLENALRYSPAGSCVTLGAEMDDGFCKAHVDDQGPGCRATSLPLRFSAFSRRGSKTPAKPVWACTSAGLPSSAGVVPSVVSPCRRRVRASGSAFPGLLCKISPHAVSVPGNGKFQRFSPTRLPS